MFDISQTPPIIIMDTCSNNSIPPPGHTHTSSVLSKPNQKLWPALAQIRTLTAHVAHNLSYTISNTV